MYYKDLPEKIYILGSVDESILNTETGEDIHGNICIFVWDKKNDCIKFKNFNSDLNHYPVSKIDRNIISAAIFNINYENKLQLKVSYIYYNPKCFSISDGFDLTDSCNTTIDVLNHCDYMVDIIEKYKQYEIKVNELKVKLEFWNAIVENNNKMMKEMLAALPQFRDRYVPIDVRREVWTRDGGSCKNCGSTYLIEFDHIIPVSKGGSNSAKNIEILCQECNRKKSNKDPGLH